MPVGLSAELFELAILPRAEDIEGWIIRLKAAKLGIDKKAVKDPSDTVSKSKYDTAIAALENLFADGEGNLSIS